MAVHDPPFHLPFVDSTFYVSQPWIEWLLFSRSNLVDIEEDVDAIEFDIEQIDINTANIATNTTNIAANTANIATNSADITTLQADILSNEALSFYFASL